MRQPGASRRKIVAGETAAPAFAADDLEEVAITGSRIQRTRDLEAPSPIVTVSTEALTNSSTVAIESVLQQLPQQPHLVNFKQHNLLFVTRATM